MKAVHAIASPNFSNEAKDESNSYDRKSQLRSQGPLLAFSRLRVSQTQPPPQLNGILS